MERPTIELVLPASGVKVFLYSYLTISESRSVRSEMLKAAKLSMDPTTQKAVVKEFDASITLSMQDLTFKLLIKEAFHDDGRKIDNPFDTIQSLPQEDGDILFEKIDEISASTSLSPDAKKK